MTTAASPASGGARLGARALLGSRTAFEVWAPRADRAEVVLYRPGGPAYGVARVVALAPDEHGYHRGVVDGVDAGDTYRYRLHRDDGSHVDLADPASRWQPEGVHGPSAVDAPDRFAWHDAGFAPRPLHEQVIYELHVGTFSASGTFEGVIGQLGHVADLGATTIELLPVWQFPGGRNWGYDGVLPFAVQSTYGGPEGLRRLVDAAHAVGIGVVLDVVYNHVGPEGNRLAEFGPYFTDRYATPWGPALNTDGPGSDAVRRWVIEHAVSFVTDFHVDGFRLDAVHGIVDTSAVHLLEALARAVAAEAERLGRRVHVIAESDRCDPRLMRSPDAGGYGLDAQWADDFHHAVHVALTGERDGYYVDYVGLSDIATMLRDRYVYAGRYSVHRGRTIGRPAREVPYDRFVVSVQNHDQIGNRMLGDRLASLVDTEGAKLAAGLLLLSPYVPLLFMGEEYAEPSPFRYFVSHTDPELVEAVRRGRREEFASFAWRGEAPDPQATATFEDSRIDVSLARTDTLHGVTFDLYRELIILRRELDVLHHPDAPDPTVVELAGHEAVALLRSYRETMVIVAANAEQARVELAVPARGEFTTRFSTADERFGGPGVPDPPRSDGRVVRVVLAPRSVTLLVRQPAAETTREDA